MTLKPANMENCDPKNRCVQGVNAGIAYTPGDECPIGYTFDPNICDCVSLGCSQFNVHYDTMKLGYFGCGANCGTGSTGPHAELAYLNFGSLVVAYAGSYNHGSISEFCDNGPQNCGQTVASVTGATYFQDSNGGALQVASDVDIPCGLSDRLYVVFVITDDPVNGALAGLSIARLVGVRWTGAIGCTKVETWVTSVEPVGC